MLKRHPWSAKFAALATLGLSSCRTAELRSPGYERSREYALCDEGFLQFEPRLDLVGWQRDAILDVFVQATDQGNHETVTKNPPQPV